MRRPDNMPASIQTAEGKRGKLFVWAIVLAVMAVSFGCGKGTAEAPPPPTDKTVAELISEADQLYAQRADVVKPRQGLIIN